MEWCFILTWVYHPIWWELVNWRLKILLLLAKCKVLIATVAHLTCMYPAKPVTCVSWKTRIPMCYGDGGILNCKLISFWAIDMHSRYTHMKAAKKLTQSVQSKHISFSFTFIVVYHWWLISCINNTPVHITTYPGLKVKNSCSSW